MAELSNPSMQSQYQLVDMVEFDVVRLLSSELAVLFVFLVDVCWFRTMKSDASISSAVFRRPRESKCRSEIHKALCALKSPNINVLCLLGAGLTQ